jgi:predicted DNA-binding protein
MTTSTIEISTDIKKRLDELSSSCGVATKTLVNEALASFLEDLEDVKQAEEVVGRLERGEIGTIGLGELEARLGLDR